MSEQKLRTVEQIHLEYSQMCARAGHLAYTVKVTQDDLNLVYEQLKSLNLEAASSASAAKSAEASNVKA